MKRALEKLSFKAFERLCKKTNCKVFGCSAHNAPDDLSILGWSIAL